MSDDRSTTTTGRDDMTQVRDVDLTGLELPEVVPYETWLRERRALLEREKALTRERDAVAAERRRLPMVEVTTDYRFDGPDGEVGLLDLFEDRLQLIVQFVMYGPDWELPCRSCSAAVDEITRGHLNHLRARTTSLVLVSRAPYPKLAAFKERMGWKVPWYSSGSGTFNYDHHATLDESVAPIEYNYRSPKEHALAGTEYYVSGKQPIELPGMSCFLRIGNRVFHTYSAYARGLEVGSADQMLELTALGRQEPWEEPKGRLTGLGLQAGSPTIPYPDEYPAP
jgi:predicted dithiol-disulfide oxidoreductase (DUF899 family)